MRLVTQRVLGECGPACVAMVAGVSIDDVMRQVPSLEFGMNDTEMVNLLAHFGIPALPSIERPSILIPAILTVPSLNHTGLLHYIVWTGKEGPDILDPTNESKRYPDDMPMAYKAQNVLPWSSAILLWLNVR